MRTLFPDFYTYFRHYCAFYVAINSFSVALKFLKGILNTTVRADIDVPRWEQNGCCCSPVFLFFYRPVLASPFRNPLSATLLYASFPPPSSHCATLHRSTRHSKATFRKKEREQKGAGAISRYNVNFRSRQMLRTMRLSRAYPSLRQTFVQRDVPSL